MRWYRIESCRSTSATTVTEWSEQTVAACGIVEAFDAVRRLGWWPTSLISSGWSAQDLYVEARQRQERNLAQRTDDTELERKARALLEAANEYWLEMQKTPSLRGALFWLDDTGGRTLIFTRGEYRTTLLSNIDHRLNDVRKQFTHLQTGYFNDADGITDEDLSKPIQR